MAGNGDIDQSELEDELPGDRSLELKNERTKWIWANSSHRIESYHQFILCSMEWLLCNKPTFLDRLAAASVHIIHAVMIVHRCRCWHGSLADRVHTVRVVLRAIPLYRLRLISVVSK